MNHEKSDMKDKKTVVVGIASGIASYKSVELVKLLRKENIDVIVVMTKSASQMVSKEEFEEAAGNKVYIDLFEESFDYKKVLKSRHVDHIAIADKVSVVIVAPATANVIAKISHGIADDFLTTMLLATKAPVIICPSMNVHMWENSIVQENVAKLKSLGYLIIEPEEGALACGYEGKGRLANVTLIRDEVFRHLKNRSSLSGKKILVTAGGTQESIDDVRFITNRSSGKMGVAIAEACFLQGADVLLLRSETSVKSGYHMQEKTFSTSDELSFLIKKYIKKYYVIYHAAAVSDFKVKKKHGKISSDTSVALQLTPQEKIVNKIKESNPKIKLIAFKAVWASEEKMLIEEGQKKLKERKADAVVVNDISRNDRGFEADTNEVIMIKKDGSKKKISLRSKKEVAEEIIHFAVT